VSRPIKTTMLSFTFLICAVVIYYLGYLPLVNRAEMIREQIKTKATNLQLVKAKVAGQAQLEQALHNAQAQEEAVTPIIPAQLRLAELYSQIDSMSQASGIKVQQITANQTFQPFAQDHRLLYIALNIEGNAYFSQVIRFLDSITNSSFLLQVENMELNSISKGSKPRLHYQITLNAFELSSNL
jgi:Tfp pilus assembly protein PilO